MNNKRKKYPSWILEFSCSMPYQFQLLCKLPEAEPERVLRDFMANAGMESYSSGEAHRERAMEYFLVCGSGQHYYTLEDMQNLFKEMESIASLFPRDCKPKMQNTHAKWREKYHTFWFKKWVNKYKRHT